MKPNKRNMMMVAFAMSALVATMKNGELTIEINEKYASCLISAIEKASDTLDEYLIQALVESRYQTATSVVWVYGCADKT